MKKVSILAAALLMLALLTACGKPAVSSECAISDTSSMETEETASTTVSTSTASTEETSSLIETTMVKETTTSKSLPSKPTECLHEYTTTVVKPSCTKQGYTEHTCKKCGKSYRDCYTSPRHEIGKYLCEKCGLPDPEKPVYGLSCWLEKNGTLAGNGYISSIEYKEKGTTYSLSTNIYSYYLWFDAEKDGEIYRIGLNDTKECCFVYFKNKITGSATVKNSALCSSLSLKLDEFENNGDMECSEKDYTAQMLSKLDGFMEIIQNKLLYPRTGLKLKDFGFMAY